MELKRKKSITHKSYKNKDRLIASPRFIEKGIYNQPNPIFTEDVSPKGIYKYASEEYLEMNSTKTGTYYLMGFSIFAGALTFMIDDWTTLVYVVFSIWVIIVLLCLIYLLNNPNKKQILDRKNSLITFTGLWYSKNITMDFNEVIFWYSTGGEDALGAFELEIVRPNTGIFAGFYQGQGDCYKDMSFVAWYMDKNRPLPPGEAFDQFRQKDFERRKAAGFPKPLFESSVNTREATLEQQKQREKIGKW